MSARLDMADVADPLPWSLVLGLAAAMTGASWMVLDWAARLGVELFAAQVTAQGLVGAGAVAAGLSVVGGLTGLAMFLRQDVVGLVAERSGSDLVVSSRTRLASTELRIPVADVVRVRVDGGQLVVETPDRAHQVALPSRSRAAVEALETFLSAAEIQR